MENKKIDGIISSEEIEIYRKHGNVLGHLNNIPFQNKKDYKKLYKKAYISFEHDVNVYLQKEKLQSAFTKDSLRDINIIRKEQRKPKSLFQWLKAPFERFMGLFKRKSKIVVEQADKSENIAETVLKMDKNNEVVVERKEEEKNGFNGMMATGKGSKGLRQLCCRLPDRLRVQSVS